MPFGLESQLVGRYGGVGVGVHDVVNYGRNLLVVTSVDVAIIKKRYRRQQWRAIKEDGGSGCNLLSPPLLNNHGF